MISRPCDQGDQRVLAQGLWAKAGNTLATLDQITSRETEPRWWGVRERLSSRETREWVLGTGAQETGKSFNYFDM